MSLIRDPHTCGVLLTFIRIYREKRAKVPVKEYVYQWGWSRVPQPRLKLVHRRPPRWACAQIAWRQAHNARRVWMEAEED